MSSFANWVLRRLISGRVAVTALVFGVAGALFVLFASSYLAGRSLPEDVESVARSWNQAIARLGLQSVFPPTEDFYVGDILAVVTNDPQKDESHKSILWRSIKLAHVPVLNAIRDSYKDVPDFPETLSGDTEGHQVVSSGDILAPASDMRRLRVVAFPGFVITSATTESETGVLGWLKTAFSNAHSDAHSTQVRIPQAETYGIPSIQATGQMNKYCLEERTSFACTNAFMRRQLSMVYGEEALDSNSGLGRSGSSLKKIPATVELYFVNRVFLTRSIEFVYGSETVIASVLEAAIKKSRAKASGGDRGSNNEGDQQKAIDEVTSRVRTDFGSFAEGGQLTFGGLSSNGVSLKMKFDRPVVIGFQAVKSIPYDILTADRDRGNTTAQK